MPRDATLTLHLIYLSFIFQLPAIGKDIRGLQCTLFQFLHSTVMLLLDMLIELELVRESLQHKSYTHVTSNANYADVNKKFGKDNIGPI